MKHQPQCNIEQALTKIDDWYRQPLGRYMLQEERSQVTDLLAHVSGRHLVQFGGINQGFFFDKTLLKHKVRLSPEPYTSFPGPSIRGDFYELPLAHSSVDVILLPHILEFVDYPKRVLSEAYHALVPEGSLLIIGFNPYSIWGVSQLMPMKQHDVIKQACFYSAYKVMRWLNALDFQVQAHQTGFFRPPFHRESILLKTVFLETTGQLCWPGGGAFYVIMAKKVVNKPSLVGLSWLKRYVTLPWQANPVSSSTHQHFSSIEWGSDDT